jgi:hypothetical protein
MGAIAKEVATGVPGQAVTIATSVLPNLGNAANQALYSHVIAGQVAAATGVANTPATLILLANTVAGLTPTNAPAVAASVASATGVAVTNAAAIANAAASALISGTAADKGEVAKAVVAVLTNNIQTLAAQAVEVAKAVALTLSPADKAVIAAKVTSAIPSGSQNSLTVGAPAVAKELAKQVYNGTGIPTGTAATEIAKIAKDVAAASYAVVATPANLALVAGTVAGNYSASLPAAASGIADEVAKIGGLTYANRAAIAKSVATAVVGQAELVATTVLGSSLTLDVNVVDTPAIIAQEFAKQITAQAPKIAGRATSYIANPSNPNLSNTKAGDIAVAVATATGVLPTAVPTIATEVASAIYTTQANAIGGIADKLAFATTLSTTGNLSPAGFAGSVALIATNLATVAAPTVGQTEQLAGIVAALSYALPYTTTANVQLIATVAKNVATVAATYLNAHYSPAEATANLEKLSKDIVGFLVAELLMRPGVTDSLATNTVLTNLRTALSSTGGIPITTINQIYGTSTTTVSTANLAPYTSVLNTPTAAAIGTIGGILSDTSAINPF